MEECRRLGSEVLGPDVNESFYKFSVNDRGAVRFGMGAIKGVGANAVETSAALISNASVNFLDCSIGRWPHAVNV